MPEGHLIHRYAREQNAAPAGQVLAVSSPQGRVDTGPYDGRPLRAVEAYGKHLLYHVADAPTLWNLATRFLALGRDAGQVVSDPDAPDERWVYKRAACRRYGSPVRTWQLGGRTAYACPVDQPRT